MAISKTNRVPISFAPPKEPNHPLNRRAKRNPARERTSRPQPRDRRAGGSGGGRKPPNPPTKTAQGDSPRRSGAMSRAQRTLLALAAKRGLQFAAKQAFRRFPPMLAAEIVEYLVEQAKKRPKDFPNPIRPPILPKNWRWCKGPATFNLPSHQKWVTPPAFAPGAAACTLNVPVDSQYADQNDVNNWPKGPGVLTFDRSGYQRIRSHSDLVPYRKVYLGTAERISIVNPQPQPTPAWYSIPSQDWSNPNIGRMQPGLLQQTETQVDSIVADHEANVDPAQRLSYDRQYQYSPRARPDYSLGRHLRVPAGVRVREKKAITKMKALGIALYKALDFASEGAEVISAVYDALPDAVKKRWEKGRGDRPGDSFGQYGLDGADWKVQALYHNWDKVDPSQAVKNIFKNQLSDSVIGAIQAQLPNNTGSAHEVGEIEFAKILDHVLTNTFGL